MEQDVIIIGGGVLGISLGYHLSKLRTKTLILEREATPAEHASGKNAGMFRHLYRHPQLTDWALRSKELWPEEIHKTYFRNTGSLIACRKAPSHHEALFQEKLVEVYQDETLTEVPAVLTREDGLLDSGGYVNAVYSHTDKRFTKALFRRNVRSVRRKGDLWHVETEAGECFEAPWLVNAAGAWVNHFLHPECPQLKVAVQPFARHLFVVHGWNQGFMPAPDCGFFWEEKTGWYVRLWEKDSRLVSICDQIPADPDRFTPPPETTEHLAVTLIRALPDVAEKLRVGKMWFCFRTYTEDMLPIWGEDETAPGFFWLGAFGGLGMSTSFAATKDAAKYICEEKVDLCRDFSPERVKLAARNPGSCSKKAR